MNSLQAQTVANYQLSQLATSSTFPLTGKTVLSPTTGNVDDAVYNFNLPFDFNFGGVAFTTASTAKLYVSTNGFATLGSAPTTTNYYPISSTDTYSGAMSVYGWDMDMIPATAAKNIGYVVSGTAPNRILKVEWVVERSNGTTASATDSGTVMIFQLWLYETTNVIEMHYNAFNPSATVRQGQIGLRGTTNTDFINLNYSTTANWPALPSTMPLGTANNQTVVTRGTTGQILTTSNRLFRWTPVTCFAPSGLVISSLTYNSATLTWNAASPAPGSGYEYYITTSATAPTSGTTPTGSVGAGVLTTSLSSLSAGTLYYVYVRSKCSASDTSSWSPVKTFTTLCTPTNTNYFMYFDEGDALFPYTVPAIPPCHSVQNVGAGPLNVWKTSYATTPSNTGGFYDEHLVYDATTGTGGTDDANVWFYTTGINLTAGTTYKLDYTYGGSTENATITNKMLVKYGTAPTDAAMTAGVLLADHNNIKASPIINYVSFTPSTTGVYYFGFKAYSAKNNGRLFLDNIELTAPGCVVPTAVTVSNVTGTSATVTWTAPSPAPIGGYAYYLTNTNTPPAYDQTPTGFVGAGTTVLNLNGLSGSTTYYIWVRGKCDPTQSDYSNWTTVQTFTTLYQPVYCTPSTASTTSYFNNFVTTGGIANISNPTGFSAGGYGNYISQIVSQSAGATVNFNTGIVGPTVGVAIYVDWNNDGTFAAAERVFNTAAYVTTCSGSFTVPAAQALGDYRMRIILDWLATSPVACSFSGPGEAEDYTFRVVSPPPALALNISSSTQCASTNSPLVQITPATLGNYNTYSWSPSIGVTGSAATGYTFNSNTTITYTLTGNQTVAPYATRSVTFTYNANPLPTPITITPTTATVCQTGPATLISATGGIVSGVGILTEDFNSGAPTWTTTNTSTGGTTTAPAWTIRNSGYNPGGSSGISSIVSNDSSQFYLSNSDAQGSGSSTYVTLTSPTFSLVGYTNASLSFYHYYKPWINGSATVEIYKPTTSSWVTLQTWGDSSTTTAQGTATNFANAIYNLNSYVGMSGLQVRFTYQASWGYVWAIDNFSVTGSASSAITWNTQTAPVSNGTVVPGLYTNAAATTPYVAGTGTNTIYALPSATTIFTASASTPSPVCTSSSTVTITVTPVVAGTASSNQTICYGSPSNLVLTGYSGTIVGWQWSSNLAFTTPNSIASSASATLTSAQMGVGATRYYRAVVSNGSCTGYSNVVTVTYDATTWDGNAWTNGVPTATKAVVFDGDYDSGNAVSPGNLNACSVFISSGDVTFLSGHSLISQNNVNTSGGTLTFENNASLVQVNNTAVNTGNITYKRNTNPVRKFDFTYWSSPVTPQTLVGLSPLTLFDKYFVFDPTVNNWVNVSSSSSMSPGKGYIIRAPNTFDPTTPAVFNGQFYGAPNNGVISTPIVVSVGNLNLIGNPYPSALNIDSFFDFNGITTGTGVVEKTIYLWTHNTPVTNNVYNNNDYAVYNYLGGVGTAPAVASGSNNSTPTGKVASGQSFFIKGLINGNATFNNSMRVIGSNNQFYRNAANQVATNSGMSRVWLELFNNQGAYKQTLVGYASAATNAFDSGYDGELLDAGTPVLLYSKLAPINLAIQGRSLPFDENDVVPLGYKVSTAGTYEIKLSQFDGIFDTQNVYLEDRLLGTIHDLKTSNYSFVSAVGTFDDRFVLRYTNNALTINNHLFDYNTVQVYQHNGVITIDSGLATMDEVKIFDVRGSLLYDQTHINSSDLEISKLTSSNQVLLISIKSTEGKVVTKKLIF